MCPDLSHVITHLEQQTPRTAGNPEMYGQFTQALEILKHEHEGHDALANVPADTTTDPNDREPSDG